MKTATEGTELIQRLCLLLVSASLLVLAGCADVATRAPVQTAKPEVSKRKAVPRETRPRVETSRVAPIQVETSPLEPGLPPEAVPEPEPVMSGNPAVIALLGRARSDSDAGQRETAGASLERALRIEPRNPWLWYQLAQLRLAQGQYAQGISLARKSISFAGQNRRLQALNWRAIGNARIAQGSQAEAEDAFSRADELDPPAVAEQPAKAGSE